MVSRKTAQPTSQLYDVNAAGEYLGVTARFVRRLIAERRVPFYKVGRHVRLAQADLDAYLGAGRVEASGGEVRP